MSGRIKINFQGEEELVTAFRNGDNQAFSKIFHTYRLMLVGNAFRYVFNEEIARDLVSDVFLALWKNRKYFESEIKIKAFLHVSIKNACLTQIRDRKYDQAKYRDCANLQKASNPVIDPIITQIFHSLDTWNVYKHFNILPKQSRRVLVLYLQGFSNPEIAQSLGIAVQTVINIRVYATKILQKQFLPECETYSHASLSAAPRL